jgi:hypothetical protein
VRTLGDNSGGNSICLNATGLGLNPTTSGLFIDPVRDLSPGTNAYNVFYDTDTKEMFYNPADPSPSLTSVSITYASTTLISGVLTENNLSENLSIPSGGRWLIQTQYRIYSASSSTASQTLINSRFTSQGFGGFGASVSYQDYSLSSFTNGSYSSYFGFTHSTSKIVSAGAGFTMFAKVEIAGQSLAGGCLGEGYATAIRIGDL